MNKIILFLICNLLSCGIQSQGLIGAWERFHTSPKGEKLKSVVIFSEGHQAIATYDATTGKFISSNGGSWELKGETMTEKVEFDTNNAARVDTEVIFDIVLKDSILSIVGSDMKFKRIDDGSPGALQGAWLMSGRIREGEVQLRDTNKPRKTMKILSGTRFQWIAYNTETKQFMGTGGGSYTTINNEYTETIEFFSRDDSKAGLSLKFNYDLIDGNWHHKGFSSKGDPIHEIWSLRE